MTGFAAAGACWSSPMARSLSDAGFERYARHA